MNFSQAVYVSCNNVNNNHVGPKLVKQNFPIALHTLREVISKRAVLAGLSIRLLEIQPRYVIFLQIEYVAEPSQLEFLRLLSDRARQRIKYNCKDSVAWGDKNNGLSKSIKIKADNGVEMHAESSNKFKPKLILDGCSVSI